MRSPLELLDFNNSKSFIVPSAGQYPHLWLWDACFHAVILAYLRPELAARELRAAVHSQRPDGMLPHIVFNPEVDSKRYRPNPSDYGTGGPYSGITQPPLVASATRIVFAKTNDLKLLQHLYPRIKKFHHWLKSVRDPDNIGLVSILHPWESGMDNSPQFDGPKDDFLANHLPKDFVPPSRADTKRVPHWQRPTDDYYNFYWGLVHHFRNAGWDQASMLQTSPFRLADVLFNSLWARANHDLSVLAWVLNHPKDQKLFESWADQTREALKTHCWNADDGFFYSLDQVKNEPVRVKTIGGFAPLYAQAASPAMAESLVEHLMDRREFYYHLGVPSTSYRSEGFDRHRYWRGPIWINMHWLLARGLQAYEYFDIAATLVEKSKQLVQKEGYWEYYDPFTGKGLGASYFSWSTLADIMTPLEPPQAFRQETLVISPEAAAQHPELATLYLHPERKLVPLTPEKITSGPPIFTRDVLEVVEQRAMNTLTPVQEDQFERRLSQVADITQSLVQKTRGEWQEYPRICDLVSVAGQRVFTGLGYKCDILWSPDLHFFLRVLSPKKKEWLVDLSPVQFGWHPISRIPLLLERVSLAIETALEKEEPPSLNTLLLLWDTQLAVHRNWAALDRQRMDRHERHAFLYMTKRHRSLVLKLQEKLPVEQWALDRYQRWLQRLTRSAARRNE
jgi:hypothetical protein